MFIGDDWAEDHHDVELQDETGRKLASAQLPEGVEGIAKLHMLIARHGGEDLESENKNYAGTSPITRASGRTHAVQARYARNNRLADALHRQAFSALNTSPGARRYYDKQRARDAGYNPALRQLGNRLVGILHGCLKTHTPYDESTAWSHHATLSATT
ncbi:hypothetical protein GCM10018966_000190 [Streptomyces yanii]